MREYVGHGGGSGVFIGYRFGCGAKAHAKLEAADARLERDLAKAQVDRVRAKLRAIESAIMSQATAAKMVQAEMKL